MPSHYDKSDQEAAKPDIEPVLPKSLNKHTDKMLRQVEGHLPTDQSPTNMDQATAGGLTEKIANALSGLLGD